MRFGTRSMASASLTALAVVALLAGLWLPGLVGNALLVIGAIVFSRGVSQLTRGWA